MTHVTDEQLGKFARQQTDLFRRVREGALDINDVSRKIQNIIEGKNVPTSIVVSESFPTSVNYQRSVENGIGMDSYIRVSKEINALNFPTRLEKKKREKIGVKLACFHRSISTPEIFEALEKIGYRPINLSELLAFGKQYPHVQCGFPVAALGSIWSPQPEYVPALIYDSGRALIIRSAWDGWGPHWRFAVVSK